VHEPSKQQQLFADVAAWGEKTSEPVRSTLALALASFPDVEAQEALWQLLKRHEKVWWEFKVTILDLVSTVARIPFLEQQETIRQWLTGLVTTLNFIADIALKGEAESRHERYEWVRKVRSTYELSSRKDDTVYQLTDTLMAAIQNSVLFTPFDRVEEILAGPTVAELPGEAGFPRCWEILAYLLPRDSRQRMYQPARAELLEDYLLSRRCRRGWWSRLSVNVVFLVRTLLLAGECGRVLFASRAVQFWLWAVGLALAWVRFMLK
jgi:hypothetical protein